MAHQFAVGAAVVEVLPTTVQKRLPQTVRRACSRAQAGGAGVQGRRTGVCRAHLDLRL